MTGSNDTDLKQKAVFLYRLLQTDLALAERISNEQHTQFEQFFEDKNDEVRERLF